MTSHASIPLGPTLARWFLRRFPQPTAVQAAAWPRIVSGRHCLISAGTGQGKTLAALLPLLERRLAGPGGGQAETVLYISPLRALAANLQAGLADLLQELPWPGGALNIAVRSGDTPQAERRRQLARPPDVLLTTPESLFVLLGSPRGRALLARVRAVVVDELHAYLATKRGAHLALSLERLQHLKGQATLQRIGLSATARPAARAARFLVGVGRHCCLIEGGRQPTIDVLVEQGGLDWQPHPDAPRWGFVLDRIADIVRQASRTLVFCNTRAQVERVALRLAERIGSERVAAHHGSLGGEQRARAEAALRSGQVAVVVCSASLELGIDIGPLDRVCQIGPAVGINLIRQRAGRSGHGPGRRPRIHLFPLCIGDALDALALGEALERHALERSRMPAAYLDVLAQHLVGMLGDGLSREEDLLKLVRRAAPWADFEAVSFAAVVQMLHDGFVAGREVGRGPLLRLSDQRLQADPQFQILSRLNPGTLPEWFDYSLVDARSGRELGRLDEEFAFESATGQAIQLGGETFRIVAKNVRSIEVRHDPEAQEAAMPFWFGEGPGRSALLSAFLRRRLALAARGLAPADSDLGAVLTAARAQLGALPHSQCIVLERFFDPGGDEHLVIHSLFGQRINRAWGLALRKRFCRRFNFELQAAVTDNAILISLGATHSFALEEVIGYLSSQSLRDVLVQAVLDTPQFELRMRWCANIALAVPRRDLKGAVPPQLQRNHAENLIARVFPDQLACLENLAGPRQVPEHPLVQQALADCLEEYMDISGLERLYRRIESQSVRIHACQTQEPSILAQCAIHAPRHAFLDPAAAEERRTRAFESASTTPAPARFGETARRPTLLTHPDALEQALLKWMYLPADQALRYQAQWAFSALKKNACAVALWADGKRCIWAHIESLPVWLSLLPEARLEPRLHCALIPCERMSQEEAARRVVLGAVRRTELIRPDQVATETALDIAVVRSALEQLQHEGIVCERLAPGLFSERKPGPVPADAVSASCTTPQENL